VAASGDADTCKGLLGFKAIANLTQYGHFAASPFDALFAEWRKADVLNLVFNGYGFGRYGSDHVYVEIFTKFNLIICQAS
jgi:hypothetical protein